MLKGFDLLPGSDEGSEINWGARTLREGEVASGVVEEGDRDGAQQSLSIHSAAQITGCAKNLVALPEIGCGECGGRVYRVVSDHLGSVRRVVDSVSGNIVQRLSYDAYGRVIEDSARSTIPAEACFNDSPWSRSRARICHGTTSALLFALRR